ncbi:MAG: hypothetical protein ACJ77K_03165 [Bacteroidia bacterium]
MKKLFLILVAVALQCSSFAQTSQGEETRSEDVSVYTDPVRRIVKVVYFTSVNSEMHFSIVNSEGGIVLTVKDTVGKGEHSKLIDLGKYPKEKYRIIIENSRMKQEEELSFN